MAPAQPVSRISVGSAEVATFANGLRAVVLADRRAPVAVCNVWVRVGSNLEPEDVRGWAHGIEHMLFKGTERRGERDFALEVADLGGVTNAGTGYETTNYHITVPAANIAGAVDILHDALFHSVLAPEALDAERPVLVHENHMYDDQPAGFGVSWRWALELAHDVSPYRHPIGGRDEVLLSTPRERIVDFWRAAYQPDNMTVVIAGDVDTEAVLEQVGATFGSAAPPRPYTLPTPAVEPPRAGLRHRLETGDLNMVYAKMVFPGLSETDPDRAALAVVQQILSDGRSSRLYRIVQEKRELVSGISLLSEAGPREGVLVVDLETEPDKTVAALQATAEVLQSLKDAPPHPDELDRAKIRTERAQRFARETVQGTASVLGWHDAMGDLASAFTFPEQVAAVDAEDVSRVCRRLFGREVCSVLLYAPREAGDGLPVEAAEIERALTPHIGETIESPPPKAPAVIAPPAAIDGAAAQDPPFEETVLRGGLRMYVREEHALPVVSVGLFAAGGVTLQPPGRHGLSHLCTQVQIKGADGIDAAALHARAEGLGASLTPVASRDHAGLFLTGLSRHLPELLEILGALAARPDFPEAEFERERRLALADLRALDDDPFQAAARELRAAFFPGHAYGAPLLGTEDALAALVPEDLRDLHARVWTRRNLHVVISGDVDPDVVASGLESALSDLPDAPSPRLPDLSDAVTRNTGEDRRLVRDVRQSVVLQAWRGPEGPNTDRAALALLQKLLNGQSGRLFEALRNRRSLCYATGLQAARGFAPGMIAAYVMTDPAQEEEAAAALRRELHMLAGEVTPREEFERARAQLVGNLLIARQSNSARVSRCANDVLYGRAPNNLAHYLKEIRALTPEDIRNTAARYLGGTEALSVRLGPAL